jgi:hypothetical protein
MQDEKFHKTIAKWQSFLLRCNQLIFDETNENDIFAGIPGFKITVNDPV